MNKYVAQYGAPVLCVVLGLVYVVFATTTPLGALALTAGLAVSAVVIYFVGLGFQLLLTLAAFFVGLVLIIAGERNIDVSSPLENDHPVLSFVSLLLPVAIYDLLKGGLFYRLLGTLFAGLPG